MAILLVGCAKPSAANIELRKRLQAMETQVADLNRQHDADVATIHSLERRTDTTTAPSLHQDQIAKLFTVHGISLNRLTGGADLDPSKPGDEGIKVYVVPTDDSGQQLKAAGSFVVEAFDLAKPTDNLVGRWEFGVDQARQNWYGQAMLYTYVLTAPWQRPPEHPDLTVKVTFHDELTGREFSAQKIVKVNLAGTTQPQ